LRGNKGDAELLASKQSTLARDWVREGRFPIQELRFALAFEADLCDKSGNRQCSRDANLDVLTVRISEDGVCHFLDASTSCDQLGQYLLTKHLAQNGRIYIAVDRSSKYELVAATLESLRGTGFKIGFVNYDASSSQ
jgi:biopolymer transport protein ExbD